MSALPLAASSTVRAISSVVVLCSVTAVAIVSWSASIEAMMSLDYTPASPWAALG